MPNNPDKSARRNPKLILCSIKYKIVIFVITLLCLPKVGLAYAGNFSVMPPIAAGGNSTASANIDIDTSIENPQSVLTDLQYIPAITIDTEVPVTGNLVIREQVRQGVLTFRFTVSNEVQDALREAWVFFWAPDVEELTVWHEHGGADPVPIAAQRWVPVISPPDGTVLWYFRTTSFSQFSVSLPNSGPIRHVPIIPIAALILASASCCIVLRRN